MIEIVFLDKHNFIKEYRHFDLTYNPGYELLDYIKYGLTDEDVSKIELKKKEDKSDLHNSRKREGSMDVGKRTTSE